MCPMGESCVSAPFKCVTSLISMMPTCIMITLTLCFGSTIGSVRDQECEINCMYVVLCHSN
jgi:hypothetical protein